MAPTSTSLRPQLRYATKLSNEDLERMLHLWGAIGQPWEGAVRREQSILASMPTYMPLVVHDDRSDYPLAVGSCIFVQTEFVEECLVAEEPYIVRRAIHWFDQGRSPFLSQEEIKAANSTCGLEMMLVTYGVWPREPWSRGQIFEVLLRKHVQEYEGYKLARIVGEPMTEDFYRSMALQGYQIANRYEQFHAVHGSSPPPVLMFADQDVALKGHDYYLCRLFAQASPVCYFTQVQQELLLEARRGGTDETIAERLHISKATVKQRWDGIYEKLARSVPGSLPPDSLGTRSKEKRRIAIQFVADNPNELRPIDRALLRKNQA